MPSSMRYPVEPFVPQSNGSRIPVPQQQEEMPARDGSETPTPRRQEQMSAQNGSGTADLRLSVVMPATNGSGRSFPSLFQRNRWGIPGSQRQEEVQDRNDSRTPNPQRQQEVQSQRNGSRTPVTRRQEEQQTPRTVSGTSVPRPQQIPMQYGNGSPSANASREPPRHYPLLLNIELQTYILFDEAARFFAQQNDNAAPHPPQLNGHGHHGNWAPHVNGHNGLFPPQPNGLGNDGVMNAELMFRPQTAPPPMLPPEGLPARDRSDTIRSLEWSFAPPPPYYQPGSYQYYPDYQYPVSAQYYYPDVQPQYPVHELKPTAPPDPWVAPIHFRKTAPTKFDDPEAKLFVGDLPIKMTTEALNDALKRKFSPFGECKVNVTWKVKPGPDGAEKPLPTGWIQYKTVFEAAKALDVAKERDFAIGNRPVRIDRADGKRICRMWPTNPHATPSPGDFKNAIRQYVHHVGLEFAYRMLLHVSNEIEMVQKNYGGIIFTVPSVGLVFRWVEDASYSEQKFSKFTHRFRLKIEHVNSGMPGWREGPVSLRVLDALILDTGEKWQEELTLSRRRLRSSGEDFPDGKMARYPERISKKLIPRSILEHPRLKQDVFGFEPLDTLDWLDLHRELPTALARAINSKKMGRINGQTNSHCNDNVNHQTNVVVSHQTNGKTNHQANSKAGH